MRPSITRALAVALPAAVAAIALPAAAEAGTANVSGGTLFYTDTSNSERNNVRIRPVNGKIVISDPAGVRSTSSECRIFNGDLECNATERVSLALGGGDDILRYGLPQGGSVALGAGNDRVFGGIRESAGRAIADFAYLGDGGFDVVDYGEANDGVTVDMADNLPNDGRPGDRENVMGFEHLNGSNQRDTLFGTPNRDGIAGGGDRDVIAGGGGDDFFYSAQKDGADDYHGGPGRDGIVYVGRTQPLTVQLDNIATDGEAGEFDNVQRNVEDVYGGSGADTLRSFGVFSRLEGGDGTDTLDGGDGPDTLIGGPGGDTIIGGAGIDVVDAKDGQPDAVDCGTEADSLTRDVTEGLIKGCESVQVGVLRLGDESMVARNDKASPVVLSWRHPEGWKQLRSVTLRLLDDGQAVGEVEVRPRGARIEADGVASIVRGKTRLVRRGKAVTAELAMRVDAAMAGKTLDVEVEATDVSGRRQLEREAGTIEVAG